MITTFEMGKVLVLAIVYFVNPTHPKEAVPTASFELTETQCNDFQVIKAARMKVALEENQPYDFIVCKPLSI
jgi:hypothetical protein